MPFKFSTYNCRRNPAFCRKIYMKNKRYKKSLESNADLKSTCCKNIVSNLNSLVIILVFIFRESKYLRETNLEELIGAEMNRQTNKPLRRGPRLARGYFTTNCISKNMTPGRVYYIKFFLFTYFHVRIKECPALERK